MTAEKIGTDELKAIIYAVIKHLDPSGENGLSLTHFRFDRVPCSKRQVYAIARKYASEWGYDYHLSGYRASGNRPFARVTAEKRAYSYGPSLRKAK